MEEDELECDKLNDSTNSVLATPLEPDEEDLANIKSVPSSQEDEIPKGKKQSTFYLAS